MKDVKKSEADAAACIGNERQTARLVLFVFSVMFMTCRCLYETMYFMVDLYRILR